MKLKQKQTILPPETSQTDFEQELIQYKNRISNILESFTDAFFEVDRNWIVTYWNKEAERLLNTIKSDIISRNFWEVLHDKIPLRFHTEYHRSVAQQIAIRFEEYFPENNIWVEVATFPSGNGLSVYIKDISASKEARRVLELERRKYNDLFNLSPVPQWVYDLNGLRFLDVNQAAIDHYGYSKEEFLEMTIRDIRPAEDVAAFDEMLCTSIIAGIFNKSSVRHQKKNGEIIDVCVEGNSICFESADARLVMVIDRTKELKADRELKESLRRFDIVSRATSDAIWDWDMHNKVVIWNKGIKGIFGHPIEIYTEQWFKDQIHPDDLVRVHSSFRLMIKNREPRLSLEYRFKCADGSYRYVLDRAFIVFNDRSMPIRMIGSLQDITERVRHIKAIESQNEKLKEISWIQSHKVRSPLTKILGLVALISEKNMDYAGLDEMVPLLKLSAEELDRVLIEIVQKAQKNWYL